MNTDSAYKNLRNSLVTFGSHSITMHRTASSNTFEKLMMKITNKNAVSATDAVLKRMNEVHKLINMNYDESVSLLSRDASRVFLTCFMIIDFSDHIFSAQGFLENRLIEEAKATLESFEHFRNNDNDSCKNHTLINDFIGKFHSFTELFKGWKNQDADKIVEVLCKAYYELEETMKVVLRKNRVTKGAGEGADSPSPDDIRIWREEIDGQKEKILEQIRIIGGERGMKKMDEMKDKWQDSIDVLNEESMLDVAKKAFWDKFSQDLDQEKPDRSMLYGLLEEIRDRLNGFTSHRDDLIAENNAVIDIDLLKSSIEHDAFDNTDFMRLVNFIIERIMKFETPSENEITVAWRSSLMGKFSGHTVKYSVLLPELMCGICKRLDKIEHDYKRYIEGCNRTSCDKCGASEFEAIITSYMGMPTMPRCPECNELLVDLSEEETGGGEKTEVTTEPASASKK